MRKLSLLALFTFVLTLAPLVAFAQDNSQKAGIVIDAPVKVDVKVEKTSVLVKPAITVQPADVRVNVQPAPVTVTPVNKVDVTVLPAPVVIQGDPWYDHWYVWTGLAVIVAGATVGGVCGTGHCGGGDHTTVNMPGR